VATWVKDRYPSDIFESVFQGSASGYWSRGIDISTLEAIVQVIPDLVPPKEIEEMMDDQGALA
jgi:glutathione S-transferase kappa 1